MTIFARRIWRDTWIVMLALSIIVVLVLTVQNYSGPKYKAFSGRFWSDRSTYFVHSDKGFQDLSRNFDVSTPTGWHGRVDFDSSSSAIKLKIADFMGKPVNNLFVAARLTTRGDQRNAVTNVLEQNPDGTYKASASHLRKGTWDLSLTARDPNSNRETDLLFRIEKQITIK